MNRIETIRDRLLAARKFSVSAPVELEGGRTAELVASRTTFSWKGLVFLSQHLVVARIDNPTVEDLGQLFQVSSSWESP